MRRRNRSLIDDGELWKSCCGLGMGMWVVVTFPKLGLVVVGNFGKVIAGCELDMGGGNFSKVGIGSLFSIFGGAFSELFFEGSGKVGLIAESYLVGDFSYSLFGISKHFGCATKAISLNQFSG